MTDQTPEPEKSDDQPTEVSPEDQAAMDAAVLADMSFDAMSPRMHRKYAQHDLFCPNDGLIKAMFGQSTGGDKDKKIALLDESLAVLESARKHLEAAKAGYLEADAS